MLWHLLGVCIIQSSSSATVFVADGLWRCCQRLVARSSKKDLFLSWSSRAAFDSCVDAGTYCAHVNKCKAGTEIVQFESSNQKRWLCYQWMHCCKNKKKPHQVERVTHTTHIWHALHNQQQAAGAYAAAAAPAPLLQALLSSQTQHGARQTTHNQLDMLQTIVLSSAEHAAHAAELHMLNQSYFPLGARPGPPGHATHTNAKANQPVTQLALAAKAWCPRSA